VVCDADLKIMDIVTRWRGSVHDSRIFRECRLKPIFEAGAFSGILLGEWIPMYTIFIYSATQSNNTTKGKVQLMPHPYTEHCGKVF
jgi:hypothetical protein